MDDVLLESVLTPRQIHPSVRPRKRGINEAGTGLRRMLEWLTASALTAGIASLQLELRETNRGARRFYLNQGFAETARISGYYHGAESAVRMQRGIRLTP
jgi:hypothetical protein